MFKFILKNFAKLYAKLYWAYFKPEIDLYLLSLQKSKFLYLGDNVKFKGSNEIYHPENISIGNDVQIGNNIFLMGIGHIDIGDGTIISRNVCIHSGNHDFKSNDMIPYNKDYLLSKVTVGKGVWIGQNVCILPGVTIGDGAIIGMGTVVSKDVGKGEIVVGMKQRSIGTRDMDRFYENFNKGSLYAKKY